jgi:Fur family zinc uptake transcriptional regulator
LTAKAKHRLADEVGDAAERAARIYGRQGLKFTILRRLVLEALAERRTPVSAYEILRVLGERYRKLSPISVYRALHSLMRVGIVRKLRTQNAYFVAEGFRTRRAGNRGQPIYLVCEVCCRVSEVSSAAAYDIIEQASAAAHLWLSLSNVEASGVCQACHDRRLARAGAEKP